MLDEQIRPLNWNASITHSSNKKRLSAKSLDEIDQQLITLSVYIEEYQHRMRNLNEKIPELARNLY